MAGRPAWNRKFTEKVEVQPPVLEWDGGTLTNESAKAIRDAIQLLMRKLTTAFWRKDYTTYRRAIENQVKRLGNLLGSNHKTKRKYSTQNVADPTNLTGVRADAAFAEETRHKREYRLLKRNETDTCDLYPKSPTVDWTDTFDTKN